MLGQRWKWPPRFGQHHTCWNECSTDGRRIGCVERWCTHQHGYNDNNYNHYDYFNHDNYDGRTNDNVFLNNNFDHFYFHNNSGATGNYYSVNINNDYVATDNNSFDNNHASARCYPITHGQRIRQQFVCVKRCTKTAAQQTWRSVAGWRFCVVRGVSRVQWPQPP